MWGVTFLANLLKGAAFSPKCQQKLTHRKTEVYSLSRGDFSEKTAVSLKKWGFL
jgi:hypothetical protein